MAVVFNWALPSNGNILVQAGSLSKWHVSVGIGYAYHQYYDIPAWNCNGSVLLLRGKNAPYLVEKLGEPPMILKLGSKVVSYLQWDRKNPFLLYYIAYNKKKDTELHCYNLNNDEDSLIYRAKGLLSLAPLHPDGRHLLLCPRINRTDPARIYDLETGAVKIIPVPGPVHRVRFTKNSDLSLFCNLETEKNSSSSPRTSWVIDAATGKPKLLITGEAGHPDWCPGGNWLSFFREGNLWIIDRSGQRVKEFTGLRGHQSWSEDGSLIVADINTRRSRYGGWIVICRVDTGDVVPLIEHCSTLTSDQASHPHPVFSPDGTKVVYNSNNFRINPPQVYVIKVKNPETVGQLWAEVKGKTVVLTWEEPKSREIEKYLIYQLKDNNRFFIGECAAGQNFYKVDYNADSHAFEVIAQEYSGLKSQAVKVLINTD